VVIGLTDAGMVKRLSDAAQRASVVGRKRFAPLEGPWPNFVDTVRAEIARITVSHRVSKKVSGALHEETIYSNPKPDGGVHVRKPLASLTAKEVEAIADPQIRAMVLAKLNRAEPRKVFANEENLPCFETADGRRIPIKRVRIKNVERPMFLGRGRAQRPVVSGNNHHVEIYAELDCDGNEREWGGEVVSMHEAYQRVKAAKAVVQRDHGPLVRFKFSLAKGDTLELQAQDGKGSLFVVKKIGPQVSMIPINDARRIEKYFSPRVNGLFKRHARKVVVSPLGEVSEAND
jgi:CRISPR-associated endonuclease Csn1